MSQHDIEKLLDRYLKGTASALEVEQVENWLAENDHEQTEWDQLSKTGRDQWLSGILTEIRDTIGSGHAKTIPLRPRRQWWKGIAAAAVLIISLSLFFKWPAIQERFNQAELTAMRVPPDQKKQITLGDGSHVWINAGTELKYPQVFNGKTREVYLQGEAYFDIKHDSAHPFIVHTGTLFTTVLGTAFNISAGINSSSVVVTVTRGKVSVSDGDKVLGVITPNQQITYNMISHQHMQRVVNAGVVIAWQQGDLHFDDITFEEAARELQERFKVKISFENDKVKNCRFSGTALSGKNLDEILRVICAFNQATYEHHTDGSISIDGQGCD